MKIFFLLFLLLFHVKSFSQEDSCIYYFPQHTMWDCDMTTEDGWGLITNCEVDGFHLVIYNKLGQVVFETDDQHELWYAWHEEDPDDAYIYEFRRKGMVDKNGDAILEEGIISVTGIVLYLN